MRMRREVLLALGLAVISGTFAAVGINGWMSSQFSRIMADQKREEAIPMTTVVVAKSNMGLGTPLTREKLVEAPWPATSVPVGAYKTIAEFLTGHQTRVALAPITENEPILPGKASGAGERFGLSTMLEAGRKAVTLRINDVVGVGGFVLPGDRVDIFVTNEAKTTSDKDGKDGQPYTDLLLQDIRVLAVDQTFDPKHTQPILGRTVTVETSLADAQRITLAGAIGTLSLVLRERGSTAVANNWKRLTVADLAGNSGDKPQSATFVPSNAVAPKVPDSAPVASSGRKDHVKVKVVRATEPTEYSVLRSDASE